MLLNTLKNKNLIETHLPGFFGFYWAGFVMLTLCYKSKAAPRDQDLPDKRWTSRLLS